MQAVVRTAFLVGTICACHTSQMNTPDAAGADASTTGPGLTVSWALQPKIPGNVKENVWVDEATFKLDSLNVTGDAASVALPDEVDLTWDDDGTPAPLTFPSAPTGLYSKLSLRVDGQLVDNSYWINGHVMVEGTMYPFKIYDRDYLDISLYQDETLAPGGSVEVPVLIELDHALDGIDWSKIDNESGTLVLDTLDSYMQTFRANLVQSFVIKSSSSGPN
jgi:hypothetical protein